MASLYADENVPFPLVEALRALGHDVLTAFDDGRANQRIPDPDVLARAVDLGRAVLTNNRRDFHRLHAAQPIHGGIITFTDDPDPQALAARTDAKIAAAGRLENQLIRIVRPN
jgi:hypothetical protein